MWFLSTLVWTQEPTSDYVNQPPAQFVDLQQIIPDIRIHSGYHFANNFTKAPLPDLEKKQHKPWKLYKTICVNKFLGC